MRGQTLGIRSVFLIPASAQFKAHWGIRNFLCWLHYSFELQPVGENWDPCQGTPPGKKSCCIHEAMELRSVSASRNSAQQNSPLPSYPVFENMESNSFWVLYGEQSVLRNPGEWIPSRKDCPARNCLWQHSQLLSHSTGWYPVQRHCQCTPLSISITQPLQRLELDFPRGNGLEYTSD